MRSATKVSAQYSQRMPQTLFTFRPQAFTKPNWIDTGLLSAQGSALSPGQAKQVFLPLLLSSHEMTSGLHFIFLHLENDFCLGGIQEDVNTQGHSRIRSSKLCQLHLCGTQKRSFYISGSLPEGTVLLARSLSFSTPRLPCTHRHSPPQHLQRFSVTVGFLVAQTKEQGTTREWARQKEGAKEPLEQTPVAD